MNEIYEETTRAVLARAMPIFDVAIIRTMIVIVAGVFLTIGVAPEMFATSSSANGLSAIAVAP